MSIKRIAALAIAALLTCAATQAPKPAPAPVPDAGVLTLKVGNVTKAKGMVHVSICSQKLFLKDDCPYTGSAPAKVGVTTVRVTGLPAGIYAAQVFQDENGDGKVNQALFGIPTEPVGFSNDAPIRMKPPKWQDAKFDFDGRSKTISLNLRHFL
ncbi:DUF2141 domain-containing protein [Stakelama sediminis]|uniref:Uncharacterized protein (DUF2141 family) n=1 Tax=Stakelama sediminis TaxID=463200 RepID=A0A840Z1Q1_9SPHN|nr:DUF2141 domain-containing protein [Stakelama sediminis]MBB5719664.1 uncharacterized protein (DUF2141 family) [Stakelama sediminis]